MNSPQLSRQILQVKKKHSNNSFAIIPLWLHPLKIKRQIAKSQQWLGCKWHGLRQVWGILRSQSGYCEPRSDIWEKVSHRQQKVLAFVWDLWTPHSAVLMARTWFSLGIVDQRLGNIDSGNERLSARVRISRLFDGCVPKSYRRFNYWPLITTSKWDSWLSPDDGGQLPKNILMGRFGGTSSY